MTRRVLNIEQMEKRANEPSYTRRAPRAHQGVRVRIHKGGRRVVPHVVPTDRDRDSFDLLSPEETAQGYSRRWQENDTRKPSEVE